ncbi:MAG: N-6 DNA methylase, partial [Candidatus Omnitrophica bacterium]|nr:N-6 DNA methylase [Candidatus Omnitrophota bacterium]
YLARYGIVTVTNLREFQILEQGPGGKPIPREAFSLAEDEKAFWSQVVARPRATANDVGGPFIEFIQRACLHAAPLVNPKDLAWFLASYARDALARVERGKDLPALESVRLALEQALGMRFVDEKGEHFFRSTLVQTIFYGVFSAWVLWHRGKQAGNERFDWRNAAWTLHVPFIRALYEELAKPSRLGPLGLVEVLEWAASVLNRVDREEFFARFQDEYAVQYFYEPFLEAYDPELRKELGVWYTPPEIVQYQVARVDTVLREELDLPDGLADPNVIVLDPCCGTAAYLVETLKRIATTLREKGGDALVASDLKQAAMDRVFGFEILPAPFVVSHLQLGLMLQNVGAPLSHEREERVGVYLTNALTGWEPPREPKQRVVSPWLELEKESDAAAHVKQKAKILVVLGNPPYNAFAGVSPEEEQGLVEPYKVNLNKPTDQGGWGIKKFNLDDLYVRFFRLAERRIAEMSGKGVVSFISNFSYLGDPSFVVMRQRFLSEFDTLWFDCMNGDSRETGKLTPEGLPARPTINPPDAGPGSLPFGGRGWP